MPAKAASKQEAELAEGRAAEQRKEDKRIAEQREAFDDLPEGPIRDHVKNLMLQRAYDLMWDHQPEAADALVEFLPEDEVSAMFDAWMEDQLGDGPKSKWY